MNMKNHYYNNNRGMNYNNSKDNNYKVITIIQTIMITISPRIISIVIIIIVIQ